MLSDIEKIKSTLSTNESLYFKEGTDQIYLFGVAVRHYYQKWTGDKFEFIDVRLGDSLQLIPFTPK